MNNLKRYKVRFSDIHCHNIELEIIASNYSEILKYVFSFAKDIDKTCPKVDSPEYADHVAPIRELTIEEVVYKKGGILSSKSGRMDRKLYNNNKHMVVDSAVDWDYLKLMVLDSLISLREDYDRFKLLGSFATSVYSILSLDKTFMYQARYGERCNIHWEVMKEHFSSWEHFSGDIDEPVPSVYPKLTARECFDKIMYDGIKPKEYEDLELSLVKHLISELSSKSGVKCIDIE